MAVTYVDTLLTDRDLIRFTIGDTVENSGAKPNGGNFSDNEIAGVLSSQSGDVNRTIGKLYSILAAIWTKFVDSKIGPRDEKLSKIAEGYRALAKQYQDEFGSSSTDIVIGYLNEGLDQSDDEDEWV